ncbi:MAG: acetolactate synthase [Proteobacteria bacterium]|nr:acetolactate synthase [Pseudomonadota bacterium]MBS0573193.1 acetolactate synthase [Pseudomonadota bacterium]
MVRDTGGPDGLTYRFRFLAPAIARAGGTVSADAAEADMQALCESYALPRIATTGPVPQEIVISLSDRPVNFGEPAPDATQYFEAYRPEGKTCVWQGF